MAQTSAHAEAVKVPFFLTDVQHTRVTGPHLATGSIPERTRGTVDRDLVAARTAIEGAGRMILNQYIETGGHVGGQSSSNVWPEYFHYPLRAVADHIIVHGLPMQLAEVSPLPDA